MRSLFAAALGFVLTTAWATESTLCAGWTYKVDLELRVTEPDLTKGKAEKAAAFLKRYVAAKGAYGEEHEPFNALVVLEGYTRKKQTLAFPSEVATREFCTWLTTEASWHE